jgi:hypothetical protein
VYTLREPLLGVIVAITPFNHPMNQVIAQAGTRYCHQQSRGPQAQREDAAVRLLLADVLYEAGLPPEMLRCSRAIRRNRRRVADQRTDVDLVTFTGGVSIGKDIAAKAVYKRAGARARRQRSRSSCSRMPISRSAARLAAQRLVQEFRAALHRRQAHTGAGKRRRALRGAPGGKDACVSMAIPSTRATTWAR